MNTNRSTVHDEDKTAGRHAAGHRSTPGTTLGVLALGVLTFSLMLSMTSPGLATIGRHFGASADGTAWVMTSYLLSASVFTPIVGRLGDLHGKRRVLIVILVLLAIGTLLCTVAPTLGVMIAGRVIQGIGGGIFPLSFGLIRDEFPVERVPGAIGLISALLGLGAGVGIALAGVIIDGLNYRALFWIPLIGVLLALLLTVRFVPESQQRATGGINRLGAVLMSGGLALVLLAVSQAGNWGWGSAKTIGLAAAGLVLSACWVVSERRSRHPLVDMRMLAIRSVWTTNLVAILLGAGMFIPLVLIPQFAQTPAAAGYGFGASVTVAGLLLVPTSLVMLPVGALAGIIEKRVGSRLPVIVGTLFALLSFVLLLSFHAHKWQILISSGVLGIGLGLAFAAMANLVVAAVPADETGVATGMNTVARELGGALGTSLAGTLLASTALASGIPTVQGYNHSFIAAILALALAVGAGLLIPKSTPMIDAAAAVTDDFAHRAATRTTAESPGTRRPA
jgi:EmrB/QacA subfamily drug resistance transporter